MMLDFIIMNKKIWIYILIILFLLTVVSWLSLLYKPVSKLKIVACDVGQGDAILITYLSTQILVDGGPDNSVLSCLGRYVPFWDRKIEMLVVTNPDADHYTGAIEVVKRYRVENFLATEVGKDTQGYKELTNIVKTKNINTIFAKKDMAISIGTIYIDILNPRQEALISAGASPRVLGSYVTDRVNDYSIVFHLKYGEFDALFTGDIEGEASDAVASYLGGLNFEYLKVPHHGSRNGLTQKLLDNLNPDMAVISVGEKNRYGQPKEEVLKMLKDKNIKILRTDEMGDVVVESDGIRWQVF